MIYAFVFMYSAGTLHVETACCRCAPFGILSQGERDGVTIHSSMGAKPLLTCPWIALLLFSMDGGVFAFRYQGREKRSLFWLQSGRNCLWTKGPI